MNTLNNIQRKTKEEERLEIRYIKAREFLKGVLATLLFAAGVFLSLEIATYAHSRNCTGCDWFWCDNYTGNGDI
jgi:hypothetical protein